MEITKLFVILANQDFARVVVGHLSINDTKSSHHGDLSIFQPFIFSLQFPMNSAGSFVSIDERPVNIKHLLYFVK